jgi:hypothetical protein
MALPGHPQGNVSLPLAGSVIEFDAGDLLPCDAMVLALAFHVAAMATGIRIRTGNSPAPASIYHGESNNATAGRLPYYEAAGAFDGTTDTKQHWQ